MEVLTSHEQFRQRRILGAAAACLGLSVFMTGCSNKEAAEAAPAVRTVKRSVIDGYVVLEKGVNLRRTPKLENPDAVRGKSGDNIVRELDVTSTAVRPYLETVGKKKGPQERWIQAVDEKTGKPVYIALEALAFEEENSGRDFMSVQACAPGSRLDAPHKKGLYSVYQPHEKMIVARAPFEVPGDTDIARLVPGTERPC